MLYYIFEDGTVKEYAQDKQIRGVRHFGERPVKMYWDKPISDTELQVAAMALSTRAAEFLYVATDKFLESEGQLLTVLVNQITETEHVLIDDKYEKLYDHLTITQAEAKEKYPEYFI